MDKDIKDMNEIKEKREGRDEHIIVGICGEIGGCIREYLEGVGVGKIMGIDKKEGWREEEVREHYKNNNGNGEGWKGVRIMHVCIPYVIGGGFEGEIRGYMDKYVSEYVIIYSTVKPGVSDGLGENVVHSPVEGRHPDLIGGFRTFRRMIGGKMSREVGDIYRGWGMEVEEYERGIITELGKLLSTTRYGIGIIFAKVEEEMCKGYGIKYEEVVLKYQRMYNDGYKKMGEERFMQSLLVPPDNGCGGHCVVPNAVILSKVSDDGFIGRLSKFNDIGEDGKRKDI